MTATHTSDRDPARLFERAAHFSRFLRRLLDNPPACFRPEDVLRPLHVQEIAALLAEHPVPDEGRLHRALRAVRRAAMLRIVTRDLAGLADLDEVVTSTGALAEQTLRFALTHLDAWAAARHGEPLGESDGARMRLLVVGMGKLGGCELNVSSDIDLIFLYPEAGDARGARPLSAHEYFTRLGKKLINALSEHTADGHVFRVDMRLRPYGDSGPLAMSFAMLENYLLTQGREWERYAWVKARELTGAPTEELMQMVRPFVYRRHLDYSAFESLRELHAQIRTEVARRELHDNIKLGPGGIREIEFVAQVFQIVRGGHDQALQLRSTRGALQLLAARQLLPAEAVEDLHAAYVFLRNLEHRLQYLEDQQTQMLPEKPEDLQLVAHSMGFEDVVRFRRTLDAHRERVTRQFEAVFASRTEPGRDEPMAQVWQAREPEESALARLAARGYADPPDVLRRLRALRDSAVYRRMSASTHARLDRLVPRLLEVAGASDRPDATLERLAGVVESIGRRESYLALLLEYPGALQRLADLAAASPWASEYLARHPILLDELISLAGPEALDWPALAARLQTELDRADNVEQQMDLLRHFKQVQTMRLLVRDLSGTLPLETLSDHLSDLACLILGQVLRLAWAGLRTRHRAQPRFAVVGYGKLGGKELGYASDLDIIFLYDDSDPEAAEQYGRLSQRINTWLTSYTSAGVLYETDLRLRPDGASGLLVSRIDAYARYQREKAWVWEHQALTRARFVAGDTGIGARFEGLREEILRLPRDTVGLRGEIHAMRRRMLEAHPNRSELFDLKHDRGGIVDVEFIVQFLVLGHAHAHRELTGNIGNLALLRLVARLGLIDPELAEPVHHAYREFRRMQHALRLQGERYARVERERVQVLVTPVLALWRAVFGQDG
ncbi:MAG: bifunctional [glutamate--ammonia ligase]-adenylyl-L-tyrosine phosphorylase/[glutamate--ammonia-ligase] adenylyltransferase [Burkholderiales bacterium]|nr:bifunctional [glutamate--ammonia ligase]-adenylyl-L-tyrosine phosphorylase/[glutamate--ammonia-ligase] adenylyltransferase [Burkholderiales bacterium]